MDIAQYFPIYNKLNANEQAAIRNSIREMHIAKGEMLYDASTDCLGFVIVTNGQLRAYITSDEGKEITIYRLLENDYCLFSASCMMNNIQFDVMISAEKDTDYLVIPTAVYKNLMETSLAIANYTNQMMSARFTDVMWLFEQIMWKSFDKRLADFLIEESALEDSKTLRITHEVIANHLGTAREVVTRMLKYFQSEGMVALSRGEIEITDINRLSTL